MSKQNKNQRTTFLAVTLIALLIVAYKVLFVVPVEVEVNPASVIRVESMIGQLNSVDLTSSAINDPKFGTLEDISKPLPTLPIGRVNPFAGF